MNRTRALVGALIVAVLLALTGPAYADGSYYTAGPAWASSGACAREKGTVHWHAINGAASVIDLAHSFQNYVCLAPNTPTSTNFNFTEFLEVKYLNGSTGQYQPYCNFYTTNLLVYTATWTDRWKTDCPAIYTGTIVTWQWNGSVSINGSLVGTYSSGWTYPAAIN